MDKRGRVEKNYSTAGFAGTGRKEGSIEGEVGLWEWGQIPGRAPAVIAICCSTQRLTVSVHSELHFLAIILLFSFLHRFWIGFRSGLWLSYSKMLNISLPPWLCVSDYCHVGRATVAPEEVFLPNVFHPNLDVILFSKYCPSSRDRYIGHCGDCGQF